MNTFAIIQATMIVKAPAAISWENIANIIDSGFKGRLFLTLFRNSKIYPIERVNAIKRNRNKYIE